MVDEPLQLQHTTYWFPTRAAGERSFTMLTEFSLNQRPHDDQPSMAEVVWSTGSVEQALSILPVALPAPARREMRRLLKPWPRGRYTDAYQRSGGILNLFTPPWGEQEDEAWAGMVDQWENETYPDDAARQAALRALEQRWNTTSHPFFAGLTPAQVMVGGGTEEAALAREFLQQLERMFDGQPFESEGDALMQTLLLLRGWQCQQREKGQTPFEMIVAERDELLARRARVLSEGPG